MATDAQREKWIGDFYSFFNINHGFRHFCHSTGTYLFYRPDKILGFRLGDQKILVSKVVNNSRYLMKILEEGKTEILQRLSTHLDIYKESNNYTEKGMARACNCAVELTVFYFADVLKLIVDCAEPTQQDFEVLSEITARYICQYEEAAEQIFQAFGVQAQEIERSAIRSREQMDLATSQRIASAPRYVHIRGKIRDGFFGPSFDGTVHVTHSMSQGQIYQAYDENRAAAWARSRTESYQAKKGAVGTLEKMAKDAIAAFLPEIYQALGKCTTKTIHREAFVSDSITAKPYLMKNILLILARIGDTETDFKHIAALLREYDIDYTEHLIKPCVRQALEHYQQTGKCDYESKILRCLLYITGKEKISDWAIARSIFRASFEEKLEERYRFLLTDASIRTKKMPPEEGRELFRAVLDEAKLVPSDVLGEEEHEILLKKADELFIRLKAERKEGLFGLKKR